MSTGTRGTERTERTSQALAHMQEAVHEYAERCAALAAAREDADRDVAAQRTLAGRLMCAGRALWRRIVPPSSSLLE